PERLPHPADARSLLAVRGHALRAVPDRVYERGERRVVRAHRGRDALGRRRRGWRQRGRRLRPRPRSMSERFDGWLFDGRTAEAHAASVWLDGPMLVVEAGSSVRRVPVAEARISEPFEHAPRMLGIADGATLQVTDGAGFTRALEAAGDTASRIVR